MKKNESPSSSIITLDTADRMADYSPMTSRESSSQDSFAFSVGNTDDKLNFKLPDIKEAKPPVVGGSMDSYIEFNGHQENKTSSLATAVRERLTRHLWNSSASDSIDSQV